MKKYCDVDIITSTGKIFGHRAILYYSQPFKNYLEYPENDNIQIYLNKFPFREEVIISYIKNLYDRDYVDYANLMDLIEFANFCRDNKFKFDVKKIDALKDIILNNNISDVIHSKIIEYITFDDLYNMFSNYVHNGI